MITLFMIKCFLIGFLGSASGGPIFMLTINRSSLYGFWHGFATALGSALVDGLFFMLGIGGILTFIADSKIIIMIMDALGGILLIALGIRSYMRPMNIHLPTVHHEKLYTTTMRSFLLTFFNPGVVFFFMIMTIKFFSDYQPLLVYQVIVGGITVCVGSLTLLSTVALLARHLNNMLTQKRATLISKVSGLLFIITGAYFFFDFGKNLLKSFY